MHLQSRLNIAHCWNNFGLKKKFQQLQQQQINIFHTSTVLLEFPSIYINSTYHLSLIIFNYFAGFI